MGIPLTVSNWSLTVQSCICCMTEYAKIHSSLTVYFTATSFLHVALKITHSSFSDKLMDVLATLLEQCVGSRRRSNQRNSVLLLGKAVKLMSVVTNESVSNMSLIKIELSKAYLHKALKCKNFGSDSIYCLSNVYLAILYYSTGQYQTAIVHSTMVIRSPDHFHCSSHVVQGETLPKFDKTTENVLGLTVFYRHVRSCALNKLHYRYVCGFTTELFAHYLCLRLACLLATGNKTFAHTTKRQYMKDISNRQQLLITDVLLFKLFNHVSEQNLYLKSTLCNCQKRSTYRTELNRPKLVELLQKSAVEHLTTYRQLVMQDFDSVTTFVTTDYEALYAYKCGDYQRCLQLSTQNLHRPMHADLMFDYVSRVPTYPEFIQLMDDDIVSLTALTLLVNPECRKPECIAGIFDDKRFYVCISQLSLSLYLMTQCQLKLHNSVASLPQTLDYIKVVQRRRPIVWTLERLTLKLTERKALSCTTISVNP